MKRKYKYEINLFLYNIIKHQRDINDEKIKMLLIRSIYHMIAQASNRPSITDLTELKNYTLSEFMRKKYNDIFDEYGRTRMNIKADKKIITPLIENWSKINKNLLIDKHTKFNFIITEYVTGKTILDLQKFYDEWKMQDKIFTSFVHIILLQVYIAFYALHLLKINHNDAHLGNFWITEVPRRNIKYKIENEIYEFDNLGIEVKIYDFDFSYIEEVGKNPFLENKAICGKYAVCNSFVPKRDLMMFTEKFRLLLEHLKNDELVLHIEKIL